MNYHNPKFGKVSWIKDTVRLILGNTIGRVPLSFANNFRYGAICFSHKYHHLGKITKDEKLLPMLTKDYDVLVCGSYQIWAPNVFNPVYFASFAEKHIRRVSYAASIGLNAIPEDMIPRYRDLLQSFYAVGIREEEWTKPYELTKMSIKKWVNSVLPVWIRRVVRVIVENN